MNTESPSLSDLLIDQPRRPGYACRYLAKVRGRNVRGQEQLDHQRSLPRRDKWCHPHMKQIIKIVVDARKAKEPDSTIVDRLVAAGVAAEDAPNMIDTIEKGFKHGTLSVVTGGMSSADIAFGQNPLFDMAFRMGRSAMRWSSPGWVLARMVLPIIILVAMTVAVVYAIAK